MKQSQREIVLNHLRKYGFVTRNWALKKYISRLGALICTFRKTMKITGKREYARNGKNWDYSYTLHAKK